MRRCMSVDVCMCVYYQQTTKRAVMWLPFVRGREEDAAEDDEGEAEGAEGGEAESSE